VAVNPPVQQKLIAPWSLVDAATLQDGLHNLIQTPDFQQVMNIAIANFFGGIFEPDLMERLRRFIAAGDRHDSRSYSVRDAAHGGPIKIAERDPSRVSLIIANVGANLVYVGGRQVTVGGLNDASGGIPIPAANYPPFVISDSVGELWAITANDGMDVRVLDIAGGI
jgi:hypothetical protein